MRIRHVSAAAAACALALLGLPQTSHVGHAAPVPTTFNSEGRADIVSLDVAALGFTFAGAQIGHADGVVDSTASPRTTASSANLEAAVAGLPLSPTSVSQTAPPDNATPATGTLPSLSVPALLTTGLIQGSANARWTDGGDNFCLATPGLTATQTTLAGLTVGNAVTEIAQIGAALTNTTNQLVPNGGPNQGRSLVADATGNIASLTLLNDLVSVAISGNPVVSATASGLSGGATGIYTPPTVAVTGPGIGTVPLTPGTSVTVNVVLVGSVMISMGAASVSTTPDGLNATIDVTMLSADVTLLAGVGTVSLDLLPLHAEAHVPAGGVECALPAPVISTPAEGALTGATPTISGTGTPGAAVTVVEGATTIGTTTVQTGGTWSFVPGTPLADGAHAITASQTLGGSSSPDSAIRNFTVDATAPAAPVITAPAAGSTINDNTPTVTGTGEPGATVEVTIDGTVIGTTTVGGGGNWTLPVTTPLGDGSHTVEATQTDAAGNESPADSVTFTVDTAAPAAPVITAPAAGSTINDNTPTVTGTGEPGATVEVTIDGTVIGTTTVGGGGNWTFPVTTPLGDGSHTVEATQTDAAGNESPADSVTFTVDTAAPAAPVITAPAAGSTINDNTPTVTGTGEPGATVEVTIDGTVIGTTTVGGGGNWTFPVTTPLGDGSHTVEATQTDDAGNESPADSVTFTVNTAAPAAPVITAPADGSTTTDNTPTITGTGEPGATVEVTIDGTVVGTATVGGGGNWTLPVTTPLGDGPHTVEATQTDDAGNESPADSVTFTIDTAAPAAPVITAPADGSTTTDNTPTITGTGEPGATVEVTIDGTVVGTATVGGGGNWTLPVTTPLGDGPHTVEATQTDDAGNESPADSVTFTIDTAAPAAPVITAPADGSTTTDNTPTVTGTGEPGATVEVTIDGTVIGTTTVGPGGNWTLPVPTPLADGPHTVEATQTDDAGNESPADSVTFTIDTTTLAPPEIDSPVDGSFVNDRTPTIRGTGQPGATVEVSIDGVVVGTAVVDADGDWSLDLTDELEDGEHTVEAVQTDGAGNTSGEVTSTFTVDATAPPRPRITSPGNGCTTTDTTPTLAGTAEPGATVDVEIDDDDAGTADASTTGAWSLTTSEALTIGQHTVEARQTDAAGNTSAARTVTCRIVASFGEIPDGGGSLPGTGASGTFGILRLATALIAAGMVTVACTRRRHTVRPDPAGERSNTT